MDGAAPDVAVSPGWYTGPMPGLMPLKHNATYEDLCVVPDHMVAEILDGDLYASPRPALPHAQASSMLSSDIIYDGSLNRGGHYELKAHSGDIVIAKR